MQTISHFSIEKDNFQVGVIWKGHMASISCCPDTVPFQHFQGLLRISGEPWCFGGNAASFSNFESSSFPCTPVFHGVPSSCSIWHRVTKRVKQESRQPRGSASSPAPPLLLLWAYFLTLASLVNLRMKRSSRLIGQFSEWMGGPHWAQWAVDSSFLMWIPLTSGFSCLKIRFPFRNSTLFPSLSFS